MSIHWQKLKCKNNQNKLMRINFQKILSVCSSEVVVIHGVFICNHFNCNFISLKITELDFKTLDSRMDYNLSQFFRTRI